MTEAECAAVIVEWFRDQGYEVYQEVDTGGARADVVARRRRLLIVVETKVRLSFRVIEQALYWRHYAHRVYVGVPFAKRSASRSVARQAFPKLGIGLIEARRGYPPESKWSEPVREVVASPIRRKVYAAHISERLHEAQKHYTPAGTPGTYWTPFKATAESVRKVVEENPGCSLKELVEHADHHYRTPSTARNCIAGYIREGVIDGIRTEQEGRRLAFYPAENGAPA